MFIYFTVIILHFNSKCQFEFALHSFSYVSAKYTQVFINHFSIKLSIA